ncbi:MAG TPA: IS110 family transposase, partial [Bacteroidetes bacterium]|nr:IS110 family transposase [Bacteroidota bacterium]HEX05661.1 IS110 family transposase [Bacteroidota bacterium]
MSKQSVTSVDVGVDVSKHILDVHVLPENVVFSVNNDADGFKQLLERL